MITKKLKNLEPESISVIPMSQALHTEIKEGHRYNICETNGCGDPAAWSKKTDTGGSDYRCDKHLKKNTDVNND